MATKKATGEILRAYGFDQEDGDALVRTKFGRLLEKFEPTEGGWLFYRYQNGEWLPVFHHIDVDDSQGYRQMTPEWVWPNEEIEKVYGTAVSARATR
jgi:hypothetical protein